MRHVNLAIALLLVATSASAQTITPEEVPLPEGLKMTYCWGYSPLGDKLIFRPSPQGESGFGPYFYFDGENTVQEVSADIMKNMHVHGVSKIENAPYGKYYFSAWGKDTTRGIYTWDGINPIEKLVYFDVNYSDFSSGVGLGSNIYFTKYDWETNKTSDLWMLDVDRRLVKQLTIGQYNIEKVKVYQNKIYFFESNTANYLHCYNPATGQITDINTNLPPDEKTEIGDIVVLDDKIIFALATEALGMELYEYDGSGNVRLLADLAKGKYNGVSSISQPFNGKIYFAGNISTEDEYGIFNLYSYDPISEQINLVKSFTKDDKRSGHPHMFCIAFGKLYFTADDKATDLQLYEYDDITDQVRLLTNIPKENEVNFYPMNTMQWRNHLYFSTYWNLGRRTPVKIFRLDPNQKPTGMVNTLITTPQVKVYPNPTSDATTIEVSLPRANKVHLTLTDVTGKQVYEYHTMSTALQHIITIPTQQLATNTYIYSIVNDLGEQIATGKLMKE